MLILIVSSGPDKGRVFQLRENRGNTIGREGDPIRLHDRKASRLHCELWKGDDGWYVSDIKSRHGTYLNQQRIMRRSALEDGDFLQVGSSVLVLASVEDSKADAAPLVPAVQHDASHPAPSPSPSPSPSRSPAGRVSVTSESASAQTLDRVLAAARAAASDNAESDTAASDPTAAEPATAGTMRSWMPVAFFLVALIIIGLNLFVISQSFEPSTAPYASSATVADNGSSQHNTSETAEQLAAILDAISQNPDRFAAVQERLDTLLERSGDPQWRERVSDRLDRQLAATQHLNRDLARWSQSVDASMAKLLERPSLDGYAERLAAAVAEAMPASPLEDAEVRETLASIRDALREQAQARQQADAAPDTESLVEAVREASVERVAQQNALLRDVLERLDAKRDVEAQLAELRTLVDRQPELVQARLTELLTQRDATAKLDRLFEAIRGIREEVKDAASAADLEALTIKLAKLEQAPEEDRLQASVEAMRALLSEREEIVQPALSRLAEALESKPSRAEIRAALNGVRNSLAATRSEQLETLAARFEAGRELDRDAVAEAVRQAVEAHSQRLAGLMQRIGERLASHPDRDDLEAALADARGSLNRASAAKFRELLDAVQRNASTRELAMAVESVLASQPRAAAAAVEKLARAVEARPTREELQAELQKARAATADDLQGSLKQIAASLEKASRLDQQFDEASGQAREQLAATRRTLAEVLQEVKRDDDLRELGQRVTGLAEAHRAALAKGDANTDANTDADADADAKADPLLQEVLTAIRNQGESSEQLAQAVQKLEAWPGQTRRALDEALAAVNERLDTLVKTRHEREDEAVQLAQLLKEVRELTRNGLSRVSTTATNTANANAAAPVSRDGRGNAGQPERGGARHSTLESIPPAIVSAMPAEDASRDPRSVSRGASWPEDNVQSLTKLQLAYKLAFETGKPVTVGEASVDPETGEVTAPRVLDPTAARAAGLTRWRDWYRLDDFSERRRMQREAREFRERSDDPDLIRLPE